MNETSLLGEQRLTPDDVRGWKFDPARGLHRGLDEDCVDDFRAQVAEELDMLLAELQRMSDELDGTPRHAPAHAVPGPDEHARQATRVLQVALADKERIVSDGKGYAQQIVTDAERQRYEILQDARAKGEGIIRQSLDEGSRMAAEVRARAEDIVRQAPIEAQAKVTALQALSAVYEDQLLRFADSVRGSLDAYRVAIADALASQSRSQNGHHLTGDGAVAAAAAGGHAAPAEGTG